MIMKKIVAVLGFGYHYKFIPNAHIPSITLREYRAASQFLNWKLKKRPCFHYPQNSSTKGGGSERLRSAMQSISVTGHGNSRDVGTGPARMLPSISRTASLNRHTIKCDAGWSARISTRNVTSTAGERDIGLVCNCDDLIAQVIAEVAC
jgi:hypothetical protein